MPIIVILLAACFPSTHESAFSPMRRWKQRERSFAYALKKVGSKLAFMRFALLNDS